MKSIQTKFIVLILGCILLSSSVIGGAGILNAKHALLENPAIGQDAGGLPPLQSRIYAADIGLVLKQNDA